MVVVQKKKIGSHLTVMLCPFLDSPVEGDTDILGYKEGEETAAFSL